MIKGEESTEKRSQAVTTPKSNSDSDAEALTQKRVGIVSTFIRATENCRSFNEYKNGTSNRFPRNIDLALLVQTIDLETIKRNLQLIDKVAPRKFLGVVKDFAHPETENKNYHLLVQYAPENIKILNLVKNPRSDTVEIVKTLTRTIATIGIHRSARWSRMAAMLGADLVSFWNLADSQIHTTSPSQNGSDDRKILALLRSMKRCNQLGVSADTYIHLISSFGADSILFGFRSIEALEKDLFSFLSRLREVTSCPDQYVGCVVAITNSKSAIGYQKLKELALIAATFGVKPSLIYTITDPYEDQSGKRDGMSPLKLLQSSYPGSDCLEALGMLFEQALLISVERTRHEGDDFLEYILSRRGRIFLKTKHIKEILSLGNSLLRAGIPLSIFLENSFYRQRFLIEKGSTLEAFIEKLRDKRVRSLDQYNLIMEIVPRARVIIEEVGLGQFLNSVQYCLDENVEIPIALSQGLSLLQEVILNDLRSGKEITPKNHYRKAITTLESLIGVVNDTERKKLIAQLHAMVEEKSQREIHKLNFYLHEISTLNQAIRNTSLVLREVYESLSKEKFQTLPQFVERTREILSIIERQSPLEIQPYAQP